MQKILSELNTGQEIQAADLFNRALSPKRQILHTLISQHKFPALGMLRRITHKNCVPGHKL